MLIGKIRNRESNIVVYGIVPPKRDSAPERVAEIAALQVERLQSLAIDGLILYDIQDEKSRTSETRPFPFIETLDAYDYSRQYLTTLKVPKIVYRSVGKYSREQLTEFLTASPADGYLTVFVGAASAHQQVSMTMSEAYVLKRSSGSQMLLGGVTIPERHTSKGDEHLRVFNKIKAGCSFFVSQGVYDVNASRNFLSDYYYYGKEHNIPLVPILFTLTPCGSLKTLEFMKWLGISFPRWLENELVHSEDILQQSVEFSERNYRELREFAGNKGIPIGCNIESVAIRKVEVEASIDLLKRIQNI